ncbi:hypothetical protein M2317_000813 [Microbacterium sp. ZKA21]|uniref:hypothetical protein n=1 Tax=Microbacterium sp. ZKA21 TaxID=3381694 RepID=UPI003D1B9214
MHLQDLSLVKWDGNQSTERLTVPPGISLPAWIEATGPLSRVMDTRSLSEATAEALEAEDALVRIEASYDATEERYLLRKLELSAPEGREVTGTLLREVAPLRIMRWVLPRTFQPRDVGLATPAVMRYIYPERRIDLEPRPRGAIGPTHTEILEVATVYRLAYIVRDAPAKAVADSLGLERRTATNWILRARNAGLLPDG